MEDVLQLLGTHERYTSRTKLSGDYKGSGFSVAKNEKIIIRGKRNGKPNAYLWKMTLFGGVRNIVL